MGVLPGSYRVHEDLLLAERNRLVLEQLPQVRCIAQRIHARLPHYILLEDLVNTGVLGLIEALAKFDPKRNVQLQSYARYRIQGAILDSLREQDWGSRLLRQKERQLEEARARLRVRLGRPPSQAELSEDLGVSDRQLQRLLSDLQGLDVTSLQEPASSEGHSLDEKMSDASGDNPFTLCEHAEMSGLLKQAMSKLSPRKRQVLELYYFNGLTMKETGDRMGVCESRISQIHTAAVASLKAGMSEILMSGQKEEFVREPVQTRTDTADSIAPDADQGRTTTYRLPDLSNVSTRVRRSYPQHRGNRIAAFTILRRSRQNS